MKLIFSLVAIMLMAACNHAPKASTVNMAPFSLRWLDQNLAYGTSLPEVKMLLEKSGIKAGVRHSSGLPRLALAEPDSEESKAESEFENFEYCGIDLTNEAGVWLGFSTQERLISFTRLHSAAIERGSFGLSIAEAFSKYDQNPKSRDQQTHPVGKDGFSRNAGPERATKATFISEVEERVMFGDDINKVFRFLTSFGVPAVYCRPLLMTDEELAKASEKFTEEERIGAEYYSIEVEGDMGMCFAFNCQKRLVRYERNWRYSEEMNGKTIADIDSLKSSEFLLKGSGGKQK